MTSVMAEVLELAPGPAGRPAHFDITAWTGGSNNRLWVKTDGSVATIGRDAGVEIEALYSRLVSPFWDAQVGARADVRSAEGASASRVGLALGLQGVAPGWFELHPTLVVGTEGGVSFDLLGSYDLYLTQRLILQPRFEASATTRADTEFGHGTGLTDASFGLRTRFEVRREFAPYVGVRWERRFGRTADIARAGGERVGESLLVVGVRVWR